MDNRSVAIVIGLLILILFALIALLMRGEKPTMDIDRLASKQEKCVMAYHGEWGTLSSDGELWAIRDGKPYKMWVPKGCM